MARLTSRGPSRRSRSCRTTILQPKSISTRYSIMAHNANSLLRTCALQRPGTANLPERFSDKWIRSNKRIRRPCTQSTTARFSLRDDAYRDALLDRATKPSAPSAATLHIMRYSINGGQVAGKCGVGVDEDQVQPKMQFNYSALPLKRRPQTGRGRIHQVKHN